MLYYLNRGFIVEQALVDIFKRYFARLRLDEVYQNFHISITNDHPFAHLVIHPDSTNTADIFPAIVITTESDGKVPDLVNMPPQFEALELTADDIDILTTCKRPKTIIDEETGEEKTIKKKGEIVYEIIPGYCNVASDSVIKELKEKAEEKEKLYGISYVNRRRDTISIEIWAENNQLKNELYEQMRNLLETSFNDVLSEKYSMFHPYMIDTTINGQRSNNFNLDFDMPLYGANIKIGVDYNIGQIVIDDEVTDIKDIIAEVKNHVKGLSKK